MTMTIETGWTSIETTAVLPGAPIQAEDAEARLLLAQLNTLDEVLANRGAPGASAQTYWGHDHGLEGGAPLTRGMAWAADGGKDYILRVAPAVPTPPATTIAPSFFDLGFANASPGLGQTGVMKYRALLRYRCTASTFQIQFNGGEPISLEPFDDTEPPRTVQITGYIPTSEWLTNEMRLKVSIENPASGMEFALYSMHIWETKQDSQPLLANVEIPDTAGEYEPKSWPGAKLAAELVGDSDSVDALTMQHALMRANAIYEHMMDRPPVGGSTQRHQGHDHDPSGYGGRAVPTGCLLSCMAFLTTGTNAPLFQQVCSTINQWFYFDESYASGIRHTTNASTPSGTATTHPMFICNVPGGFTSSGNPPTTHPYLMGVAYITHGGSSSDTIECRVYNIGTTTHSAVASVTTSGSPMIKLVIEKIPCNSGWNRFAVEVRQTTTSSVTVDLNGFQLFAVGQYDGTNRTHVDSTGTGPLAVANRIVKP